MKVNNSAANNNRAFRLSKRQKQDTRYITREYVNSAVERYLEDGGKITIIEAQGTPAINYTDPAADEFLME